MRLGGWWHSGATSLMSRRGGPGRRTRTRARALSSRALVTEISVRCDRYPATGQWAKGVVGSNRCRVAACVPERTMSWPGRRWLLSSLSGKPPSAATSLCGSSKALCRGGRNRASTHPAPAARRVGIREPRRSARVPCRRSFVSVAWSECRSQIRLRVLSGPVHRLLGDRDESWLTAQYAHRFSRGREHLDALTSRSDGRPLRDRDDACGRVHSPLQRFVSSRPPRPAGPTDERRVSMTAVPVVELRCSRADAGRSPGGCGLRVWPRTWPRRPAAGHRPDGLLRRSPRRPRDLP